MGILLAPGLLTTPSRPSLSESPSRSQGASLSEIAWERPADSPPLELYRALHCICIPIRWGARGDIDWRGVPCIRDVKPAAEFVLCSLRIPATLSRWRGGRVWERRAYGLRLPSNASEGSGTHAHGASLAVAGGGEEEDRGL